MHEIKIANFEAEYKRPFPPFEHLGIDECWEIQAKLKTLLDLHLNTDLLELARHLERRSTIIPDENANAEEFQLSRTLAQLAIGSTDSLLINWYRFDDIDRMNASDVDHYFSDLWYPGTDDIDILDEEVSWIISIYHYGSVAYIKRARE